MKNKLLLTTLFCSIITCATESTFCKNLEAQTEENSISNGVETASAVVKMNLPSLVFRNYSFQGEYFLKRKISAALSFRFMPTGKFPFSGTVLKKLRDEEDDDNDGSKTALIKFLDEGKIGGWAITPEFRYYLGKGYGKGFYIAPFLRYEYFNLSSSYYLETDFQNTTIPFKGDYKSTGAGILFGVQKNIGKHISIDFWTFGPYYASNKIKLEANNLNLSADEIAELKENLNDADFANLKFTNSVTNSKVSFDVSGGFFKVRFGVCVGYKF